jgi:dUTP pyrophosphatase
MSTATVIIQAGERFAQGIFQKYLKTDDDIPSGKARSGGYGSTGQ